LWKKTFPDATILPEIGFPKTAENGVMTLTHTLNSDEFCMKNLKINGMPSNSHLANNTLFSTEISKCTFLNLYESMLPDIPGHHIKKSTVQFYI